MVGFVVSLLLQWVLGMLSVLVILVGSKVIGSAYAAAIDFDEPGMMLIGIPFMSLFAFGALYLVALASALTMTHTAAGWLGMVTRKHPFGYGEDDDNIGSASGYVLVALTYLYWGHSIWSNAHESGDPHWVVVGLFFGAGGLFVGLIGIIPHTYFAFRPGIAEEQDEESEESDKSDKKSKVPTIYDQAHGFVMVLVPCAVLGLAFSDCVSEKTGNYVDEEQRIILAYGDWAFATYGDPEEHSDAYSPLNFMIRPSGESGRRLRVIFTGASCTRLEIRNSAGVEVPPMSERERIAFGLHASEPRAGSSDSWRNYVVFDAEAHEEYTLNVTSLSDDYCHSGLRFVHEPSSEYGESAQ